MTDKRKESWRDLAIHGGVPAFDTPLHVGRPNIGDRQRFLERVEDALDRKWLSNNGPYVQEFEQRLVEACREHNTAKSESLHCVAVANGTLALELAAAAVFPAPNRQAAEVIVPSLTFVATAHALAWRGYHVVFADVDPSWLTLDPNAVRQAATERTVGICGVHLFGQMQGAEPLHAVADELGLPLMIDASHALLNDGLGQWGRVECVSLHATKFIGCGEGGAIFTRCDKTAEQLRSLRNFGYSADANIERIGVNAKMSELSAAMGLSTLEQQEQFLACNRRNFLLYKQALEPLAGITLQSMPVERANCQYVVIRVSPAVAGIDRDTLLQTLHAEQALARPYFWPGCHQLPPYESSAVRLPVTEQAASELLALPTGTEVTARHIQTIVSIIQVAQKQAVRAA